MSNPYPNLPQDQRGEVLQQFPAPKLALTRHTSENATASSVISVSHDTTAIEITAVDKTGFMRWVTTADVEGSVIGIAGATANYDHIIPAGTVRQFAIPRESAGTTQSSIQGINRGEGLYQRVAFKSAGISSVLLSEY